MSAIYLTCEFCNETYIAGVVGTAPWPPHVCRMGSAAEGYARWADDDEQMAEQRSKAVQGAKAAQDHDRKIAYLDGLRHGLLLGAVLVVVIVLAVG